MFLNERAKTVLKERYVKKDAKGNPIEEPEDVFKRVAHAIAVPLKGVEGYEDFEEILLQSLENLEFVPNSPTLMNAGKNKLCLSACFVVELLDSMSDIYDTIKRAALIQKAGGGVGADFSRIRESDSPVSTTGGKASGPISFLRTMNASTESIKQGGTRRGANMAVLRVDHPDILDFIACKDQDGEFSNFNISIGITNDFMEKAMKKEDYDLISPITGKVGTLNAGEVFELILEQAWKNGEPGLIFLDKMNEFNAIPSRPFRAVNPCFASYQKVYTHEGFQNVEDIANREDIFLPLPEQGCFVQDVMDTWGKDVVKKNGSYFIRSKVTFSGNKEVREIVLSNGSSFFLTDNHPLTITRFIDNELQEIKVSVKGLQIGDLIKENHNPIVKKEKGYLNKAKRIGHIIGWLGKSGYYTMDRRLGLVFNKESEYETISYFKEIMEDLELSYKQFFLDKEQTLVVIELMEKGFIEKQVGYSHKDKGFSSKWLTGSRSFLIGLVESALSGSLLEGAYCTYYSNNHNNLIIMQSVLSMLGLTSCIDSVYFRDYLEDYKEKVKKTRLYIDTNYDVYKLTIEDKDLIRLYERMQLVDPGKEETLKGIVLEYESSHKSSYALEDEGMLSILNIKEREKTDTYDITVPVGHLVLLPSGVWVHNCGEQMLDSFDSCNLGSINLNTVLDEMEGGGYILNMDKLRQITRTGVQALDSIITINNYPLEEIKERTLQTRNIGLGIMGLADMLIKLDIPYASQAARDLSASILFEIREEARLTSCGLAGRLGSFPWIEDSIYKGSTLRNATITTIAPTGTISIIANCSSGMEPLFALGFTRNQLDREFIEVSDVARDYLIRKGYWNKEVEECIGRTGSVQSIPNLPKEIKEVLRTANEIGYEDHVLMQSALQEYIDSGISKTVNLDKEATVDDVRKVYLKAYETRCKGITVYRDGSREGQVLTAGTSTRLDTIEAPALSYGSVIERPKRLYGITEKVSTGCGNLYVTVNTDGKRILEVITNNGKASGCDIQSQANSRNISIMYRSGLPTELVIKQSKGLRCPSALKNDKAEGLSCPDIMARVVMSVQKQLDEGTLFTNITGGSCGGNCSCHKEEKKVPFTVVEEHLHVKGYYECPECGNFTMAMEEGCRKCIECGYSRC